MIKIISEYSLLTMQTERQCPQLHPKTDHLKPHRIIMFNSRNNTPHKLQKDNQIPVISDTHQEGAYWSTRTWSPRSLCLAMILCMTDECLQGWTEAMLMLFPSMKGQVSMVTVLST